MAEPILQNSDHDLLIRVDTKLETLIGEVQLMRDGTNNRLTAVEQNKLDTKTFSEYKLEVASELKDRDIAFSEYKKAIETAFGEYKKTNDEKIDKMRTLLYIGVGILATLQFVAPFVIKALFQ